ncbi:MAG: DUF5610 domain-containing protein [Planctomycetes bacterium]|nr:DUF5610 domain-containing protein [Planctomycetota bacterium]
MINNEFFKNFNPFGNRNNAKSDNKNVASQLAESIKNRTAAKQNSPIPTDAKKLPEQEATSRRNRGFDRFERSSSSQETEEAPKELSANEKRQAALKKIMDRLDAEEAAKNPNRAKDTSKNTSGSKTDTSASSEITTVTDPAEIAANDGLGALLNDLPLFNEFKAGLAEAFKSMDGATYGAISAQYELNYSSMEYIADAAGNYEMKETKFSMKLDLNYVQAASGKSAGELADSIANAEDFESLVNTLAEFGKAGVDTTNPDAQVPAATDENNPLSAYMKDSKPMSVKDLMNSAFKNFNPSSVAKGVSDYFSPEATSGRILDFAKSFYPMSDAIKKAGGDTPEAREEFAELMRGAIQKGFDQALGSLGAVPKNTMDGINKTHELTMKGLDDFVKEGTTPAKQPTYDALQAVSMSFDMSYSQTTVKYTNNTGRTDSTGITA